MIDLARQYNPEKLVNAGFDLNLIANTQPEGNMKIYPNLIQVGNTYMAFVDVYGFPTGSVAKFWLSDVINNADIDMISYLSVGHTDKQQYRQKFNQTMNGLEGNLNDDHIKMAEKVEQQKQGSQLLNFWADNDALKKIFLRLEIYADSIDKIESKIEMLKQQNYNFKMNTFIDEQLLEYQSIFLSEHDQEKLPNKRVGKLIQGLDLAAGYPFDYTQLADPGGKYFGNTMTNGSFSFNPYALGTTSNTRINNNRTRAFQLIAGITGQGKSTFMKMLNDDAFERGQHLVTFDVKGEFVSETLNKGGVVVDTNDDSNMINMFEIFPTATNGDASKIDVIASFNHNIARIKTIAHIMNVSLTTEDLNTLEKALVEFYVERGMYKNNPKHHLKELKIIGLPHDQYPTLNQFLVFLEGYKSDLAQDVLDSDDSRLNSVNRLLDTFQNMEDRYPSVFDGFTSNKLDDLPNQKVIDFNMFNIKQQTVGSDASLFQAQFFSYLSLIESFLVINGTQTRKKLETGALVDDGMGFNIDYYYINLDEAQNYFNRKYTDVIDILSTMMQEMRKDFAAVTLAFPSLEKIMPDQNQGQQDPDYADAIKAIFGQFQYYHFFNLPDESVERLKFQFSKSGTVTGDQLDTLPSLEKHQLLTIINANGENAYRWEIQLSKQQMERYGHTIQ